MNITSKSSLLFLEDLSVGTVFTSETYLLDERQIVEFAKQFDPQPFHVDSEAAMGSLFAGLAASGWHTAAITMKLLVPSVPLHGGLIGAGAEVSWPAATRPGDTLQVKATVLDITPSKSKLDRGIVTLESVTTNQHGVVLQRMKSKMVVFKRVG